MVTSIASDYFPVHAHSEWSVLDGMGSIEDMVRAVVRWGQPALALTDHGTMAGCIRLYKECNKHGVAPYPGSEFYVVRDVNDPTLKTDRYHLGLLALDYKGYQALIKLSSLSHKRERFHRKPLIDLSDLATLHDDGLSKHIALTTGCHFGLVVQQMYRHKSPYDQRQKTVAMMKMLAHWFPHTYVEVQNHGIETDDHRDSRDAFLLMQWADELGLPVVLGQDSHYCSAKHQSVHDLMKDICYFGDGEDNRFPGGPYHLASVKYLRSAWTDDEWDRIEEGHADLLDRNKVSMPALDKYKFYVPNVSDQPERMLGSLIAKGIERRGIIDNGDYKQRINQEVTVINKMGMANYFLLIHDVTEWCRLNNVIVQARGSANGSLVCYLLGITEVDPLLWDTDFDRFLSLDRKKPPDIDLDVESSKRSELIAYLQRRHPDMVHIGTYQRIGVTESEDEDGLGQDKGSAVVQYMAAMRRKLGDKFDGKIHPDHREPLNKLSDMQVRKSLGVHAAGIVLPSKELPIDAYLATALVPSSNTTVTQAVMEDVEECGYVKGDFLGLKQLETLNGALRNIGRKPNDWSWMPWNDAKACKVLRSGYCAGVFQFSGFSTTLGGREMGVRSTMDAILCLALYRPALMHGGQKDLYLGNRKAKTKQDQVRLHKLFDPILDVTAGVPVFQEQVMQMCRKIGMSYDDWNDLMKAVKASNDKIADAGVTFRRLKPIFQRLCIKAGLGPRSAQDAWEAVVGFTDYGFNRAHATGYGITAYRSAYLKAHYPLEFMQSLLTVWAGTKNEVNYIREARRMGIQIARADVNLSDVGWVIDPSKKEPTLRKGLLSLSGIGDVVAESIVAHRPVGGWQSIEDMITDVPAQPVSGGRDYKKSGALKGKFADLRKHGALQSLGIDP